MPALEPTSNVTMSLEAPIPQDQTSDVEEKVFQSLVESCMLLSTNSAVSDFVLEQSFEGME